MRVVYKVTRGCVYCGSCPNVCTAGAIEITNEGAVIDQEKCIGCGLCYKDCVAEAIERIELSDDKKRSN